MKKKIKILISTLILGIPVFSFASGHQIEKKAEIFNFVEIAPTEEESCCQEWCQAIIGPDAYGNPIIITYCCRPCAQT